MLNPLVFSFKCHGLGNLLDKTQLIRPKAKATSPAGQVHLTGFSVRHCPPIPHQPSFHQKPAVPQGKALRRDSWAHTPHKAGEEQLGPKALLGDNSGYTCVPEQHLQFLPEPWVSCHSPSNSNIWLNALLRINPKVESQRKQRSLKTICGPLMR